MNINFSGNNFSEALFGKIWQLPPSQPGWYLLHSIPDKPSTWYYTKFFNLVLGTLMSLTSFFSKVIIERSKLDTKTSNGTWFDSYRYLHTRLIHFNPMLHFDRNHSFDLYWKSNDWFLCKLQHWVKMEWTITCQCFHSFQSFLASCSIQISMELFWKNNN